MKAGDKVAIEIAEQFGEYLGKGLAVVANVVDPQIFVIGGGVSKAGDILFIFLTAQKLPHIEQVSSFSGLASCL